MLIIPLEPIPNQSLFIDLEGVRHRIEIKDIGQFMSATIERDGATIVQGVRCVAEEFVIRPLHLWYGNFLFLCDNDGQIPRYEDFGGSCFLIYLTNADLIQASEIQIDTGEEEIVYYLQDETGTYYLSAETGEILVKE